MKTQVLLAATLAALSMNGASIAGENEYYEAPQRAAGAPVVSRAEVLAELKIWRQSGLAELEQLEVPPMSTREYVAAAARYDALRRSPEFAALVRSIAGQRAEAVAATTKTDTAAH